MEEQLLNEWQERLGLQDWAITLRYNCKKEDMDDPEYSVGETQWETTNKCARIQIISAKEYGNDRILAFDFEKTLVHELLHCKFSMIDKDLNTYEGIVAEQARHQLIDDLARALVLAKRNETKRKLATDVVICKDINDTSTSINTSTNKTDISKSFIQNIINNTQSLNTERSK